MSSTSSVRVRLALAACSGGELDAALCDWLAELLRGEDGLGVDVDFAAESLSSFLSRFPPSDSPAARVFAASAIAAACGKVCAAPSETFSMTPMSAALAELNSAPKTVGGATGAATSWDAAEAAASAASGAAPDTDTAGDDNEENSENSSSPAPAPAGLLFMLELFPTATRRALTLALTRASGDVSAAAAAVLDAGGPEALDCEAGAAAAVRAKSAAADVKSARASILSRFGELLAETSDVVHRPLAPAPSSAPKKGERVLRYVDGVPVHLGVREKFIVEKPADAAGTFVSLKMAKKGSGGPSPCFKK